MYSKATRYSRIEVCGVIGSGKTTFANLFRTTRLDLIEEAFELNPFINIFHSNPQKYGFETQVTFLLQHYHQIKCREIPFAICDFSTILDMSYATLLLEGSNIEIYRRVYDEVIKEIGFPSILIHLDCKPATCLMRIKRRGRTFEEIINLEYLENLNNSLNTQIYKLESSLTKIISINTEEYDLLNNLKHQKYWFDLVLEKVFNISKFN